MSDFVDPYIDEETGVLRNLLGAKNLQELREAEGQASIVYALDLDKIPRTNNLDELCAIHKTLFSHIYDWAGEIRSVDIKKGSEDFFLTFPQIETGAKYIFNELEKKFLEQSFD